MRVSISRAWDETLPFLRRERSLIFPIALAFLVVPAVIVGLIQPSPIAGQQPEGGPWMLAVLIGLIVNLIGQLTIMRLALGWNGKVAEALRFALQRFWTVVGAYLLLALIVTILAIPLILIASLGGDSGADPARPSPVIVSVFVLSFLFTIARVLPLSAISLEEKLGPWPLLKRSWALTRGSYWRLLGFFLVFLIGSLVISWAVNIVASLAFTVILGPSEPFTVSRLLVALAEGVVQGAIQSIYAVMIARIAAQLLGTTETTRPATEA